MKSKILDLLIILTSLIGYLEWGKDQHRFLFNMEAEIIVKLFSDPLAVLHPLIILPILGQTLILISLFHKKLNKWLILVGISFLFLLLGFIFVIGLISFNIKILSSTLPFILLSLLRIITILKHR